MTQAVGMLFFATVALGSYLTPKHEMLSGQNLVFSLWQLILWEIPEVWT